MSEMRLERLNTAVSAIFALEHLADSYTLVEKMAISYILVRKCGRVVHPRLESPHIVKSSATLEG
jgi:hypothetical protein